MTKKIVETPPEQENNQNTAPPGPEDKQGPPPPGAKKRFGFLRRLRNFTLALLAFAAGYVAIDAYMFMKTPAYEHFSQPARSYVVRIEPGDTFDRVAWQIYKEQGIASVWRFRLLARLQHALGAVQAGDFELRNDWTPDQVLQQLISGKAMLYPITIKEGLPWWEVAALLEEKGFARAEDFKTVIHDPAFLRYYGIPFANAEGFIYPETYLLRKPRALDPEQARYMAGLLVETFWRKSAPLWNEAGQGLEGGAPAGTSGGTSGGASGNVSGGAAEGRAEGGPANSAGKSAADSAGNSAANYAGISPLVPAFARSNPEDVRRLIILASLVEKESARPDERPTVAGVYANRLRIGMLLQCDPTIIYGLGKKYNGTIYRSQIDDAKNLYNTYQHAGLPPGPICSPGQESLRAAFSPAAHNFLYFVATGKPDGSHTFSRNLEEHNRAVQIYRQATRNK